MTRKEAAEKVAKLMRLSKGSSSPNEANTARSQAEKLVAEHKLSPNDLLSGEMAAAFDDLVDGVLKVAAQHPISSSDMFGSSSIISDVLRRIKGIDDSDKAAKLKLITTLVRTASFLAGDKPLIAELKSTLDTTLKNHGISL